MARSGTETFSANTALDASFNTAPQLQFDVPFDENANSIILGSRKAAEDSVLVAQVLPEFDICAEGRPLTGQDLVFAQMESMFAQSDGTDARVPPCFQFAIFDGEHNTKFRVDENGKVSEFNYLNNEGRPYQVFADIRRSDYGQVLSFRDIEGRMWFKKDAEPESELAYERNGDAWSYVDLKGNPSAKTYDFGDIVITETGMHGKALPSFVSDGI